MEQVKNSDFNKCLEDDTKNIPHTPEEDFVARIYHSVDEAARQELLLLRSQKGINPTCKRGCFECCKQFILINRCEAHALGQFVRRRFSEQETNSLKYRTRQWHQWNDRRPEKYPLSGSRHPDFSIQRPFCPLLVDGCCSVYPMRPITCRTHFVCSAPSFCRFSNHAKAKKSGPLPLSSVKIATNLFSNRLREGINKNGSEFSPETSTANSPDTMLLPHWLAIEMRWDFAISA